MGGWTIVYALINFAILAGALFLVGRKLVPKIAGSTNLYCDQASISLPLITVPVMPILYRALSPSLCIPLDCAVLPSFSLCISSAMTTSALYSSSSGSSLQAVS